MHGQLNSPYVLHDAHFAAENADVPVPQTVRKLLDRRGLVRTRETEPAQLCPPRLHVLLGVLLCVQPLEVLNRLEVVRELVRRVLRVLGKLEADVP